MALKIGQAKYGFTQKKYFKLKDGESTFRILPPLGDLADKGIWSVFYKVHYGYKNTKGKLRVFQSSLVENRKTKMIDVPDAADQRIKDLKAKLEEAKLKGNKAVVEALGKLVSGQKPMYNLDSNHYMNAIDAQGNIGVLKLRHRAKQALDDEIKKLREKGTDPLSVDNGRYFVFRRSGTAFETSFKVDILKEKLTVAGVGEVERDVIHKLSDELLNRLEDETQKLDQIYKSLSAQDIQRIVDSTDLVTGQSPVIDELFDGGEASEETTGEEEETAAPLAATATATPAPVNAAPAQLSAPPQAPAQQAAQAPAPAPVAATLAPAEPVAPKTVAMTAAVTPSNGPTTTAEQVANTSDADFLKSLGL